MKLIKLISTLVGVAILVVTVFAAGTVTGTQMQIKPKPYDVLGFYPVCETSPEHLVRAAQAECARHEIPCVIDGKCGPETYRAICELMCKLEYEGD